MAYQGAEADLWEHMALTRARVLAGDEDFGADVMQAIAAIGGTARSEPRRCGRPLDARAHRTGEGRRRPWDLKLARGGLTDLDFIAQALVLAYGHAHPGLIAASTEAIFAQARRAGLLSEADAGTLIDAHQLLNDIFQWQRLTIEGAFDAKTVPPVIMKRLAAVAGLPSAQVLARQLDETRGRVREVFERVLGA